MQERATYVVARRVCITTAVDSTTEKEFIYEFGKVPHIHFSIEKAEEEAINRAQAAGYGQEFVIFASRRSIGITQQPVNKTFHHEPGL
jgi:hypothetical protein